MTIQSLEYVTGNFVFRLQASQSEYDSHIQIFTRRHFDNCLANKTLPWAFEEIKVKADNGEFVAFDPEYGQFVDFCERWISNPMKVKQMVRAEIQESEKHNYEQVQLSDAPFVVKREI